MGTKVKTLWYCGECGYESVGYLGRCLSCGAWESFKQAKFAEPKNSLKKSSRNSFGKTSDLFINAESQLLKLEEIPDENLARYSSGFEELDKVLGAGIVPGSVVLLGGEPGIGKSTLLLQVAHAFSNKELKVIYVSAEESSRQLKIRANRLNFNEGKANDNFFVFAENNLELILNLIETEEPNLVIIDSIQAIHSDNLDALPGMPSQIRECCSKLMRLAKTINVPIFLVGHINKDGDIAGPKILEHMVDTVIQFEGAKDSNIRFIRAIKNRFGDTNEIGLFTMNGEGLKDLSNPSEIFLEEKSSGIIFAFHEARRSLLLEIQTLVLNSNFPNPRRFANGIELNRLHQILAIIEKKLDLNVSKADIYLNVVGGIFIKDTASDLAVALAVYKSAMNFSHNDPNNEIVAVGELGLTGEIRSVTNCESRIREAQRLGFKKILIPNKNFQKINPENFTIKIFAVENLADAVKYIGKMSSLRTERSEMKQSRN